MFSERTNRKFPKINHAARHIKSRLFWFDGLAALIRWQSVCAPFSSRWLRGFLTQCLFFGSLREKNHQQSKDQQRNSPNQVDVNAQRVLVDGRAHREEAEQDQQSTQAGKEKANRYPNVKTHGSKPFELEEDDV